LVVARALTPAILALAATLAHGISATTYIPVKTNREHRARPRIAIIQTDMQCGFKGDPERDLAAMGDQIDLSIRTAQNAKPPVDLIVWPETMFRQPLLVRDEQNPPAAGSVHDSRYTAAFSDLKSLAVETGAALLVGIDRVIVSQEPPPAKPGEVDFRGYNAAIAVDRQGELVGLYAKMHLLPFGEYIPLAWLPGLASLVPITGTSVWGERPAAFEIDGVVYAPNICYESVLPHLIRRQVRELAAAGQRPDVLVNLTNDSWFLGSSELDMHLASGVFRAIEMRTPLVIAANRGLSAYITSTGKIAAVTERDRADALVVDVPVGPEFLRDTLYIRHGDWLPLACLSATTLLALAALGSRQPR
jgi:apolipoprotein N-acyltransferase